MAVFNQRTTAPEKDNKFFYSDENPYVKKGYGLPNCTCYACGRFAEIHGEFVSELGYGNAEDWYARSSKLEKGQEPQLGAIACWAKGKPARQADGAGHVAIVESIDNDGNITISASNYSGKLWYTKTYKKKDNYSNGSEYTFLGFIYPKEKQIIPKAIPTDKNENVDQIFVYWPTVRTRASASLTATSYGSTAVGYYDILDVAVNDGYTWYKICSEEKDGFDGWIAYSEDWEKLYIYNSETEELKKEIESLKKNIEELNCTIETYQKRIEILDETLKKIQNIIDEVK